MESNDKNKAEVAGPVVFAIMLFALVVYAIYVMSK